MSAIKPGDLVMIANKRPCCGTFSQRHGLPFTVIAIAPPGNFCVGCGTESSHPRALGSFGYYDMPMLKKIDPPAEGETREAYKELVV